jgi:cellulose synthase/poly-beta-1,6-N-acetylglucosamine synthase-like glycosyltransferase
MNRDSVWTLAALAATLVAVGFTAADIASTVDTSRPLSIAMAMVAVALLCGLTYGSLVYLVARWGRLRRRSDFQAGPGVLDDIYAANAAPRVCVLIPSYKEEVRVLRQTVVSAALAEYPSRRIVVLLDDPPSGPGSDPVALAAAQRAIGDLHDHFHHASSHFQAQLSAFLVRSGGGDHIDVPGEARRLAHLYEEVVGWIEGLGERAGDPAFAHVDRFFNDEIVRAAADVNRQRARRLLEASVDDALIVLEYKRLASLLHVEIGSFERKRYANLSHAPSKAMNLNSYIGLLGRSFRRAEGAGGICLAECPSTQADLTVPRADFLLTLDADSLVRHDYLLKLASIMRSDSRIAVAQTPYSAYPNAPTLIERIAGAQTDLQYLVHQGSSHYRAAYWVGANALLRASALQDIRQTTIERGQEVHVFIQDKTVIEDTGSTLDLVRRGWTLHNHPERLAYSATPPDFGSLIIQRRRWANGGLIILADLVRYALRPLAQRPGISELFVRTHYLCSPTISTVGMLLFALLPMHGALDSPWLALSALPYFALYGIDLSRCGYRWRDLPRVYALNLMLLPINLDGVMRSIHQLVTGKKSSFARTPKVGNRTSAPAAHVAIQIGMLCAAFVASVSLLAAGRPLLSAFALFNAACLMYGIARFIGVREAWQDLCLALPRGAARPATAGGGLSDEDTTVSSEDASLAEPVESSRRIAQR